MNKDGLPPGLKRQKSGNIFVQHRIYYHRTAKFAPFTCGSYETLEHATKAKEIASTLTGNTNESKMKVRESKIREEINKFRASIGLRLLKMKY